MDSGIGQILRALFSDRKDAEMIPLDGQTARSGPTFYTTHTRHVERLQDQQVEQAELAMIVAQANKIAHDKMQADIDILHADQACRVLEESIRMAWDAMERLEDDAAKRTERHPQLEAKTTLMKDRGQGVMAIIPGIAAEAYLRRYYQIAFDPGSDVRWDRR